MNPDPTTGPNYIADDCNCIYLPYLDGGSFSGYRTEPWPVSTQPGKVVYYRGLRNLDATLAYAFEHLHLTTATEMVVTGGSAGGLSTFLHSDRIGEYMREKAPSFERITAAPVVGFFLDHANYADNVVQEVVVGGGGEHYSSSYPHTGNYSSFMEVVYHDQNVTAALNTECLATFPTEPHYCFMSPHMAKFMNTPFFMFNSRFDAWQMDNDLQIPCSAGEPNHPKCNSTEQAAIVQYGADFITALQPVVESAPKNGAFITSCICHGCNWTGLVLEGATSYHHYLNWFQGKSAVKGGASIHIDDRAPNGGGVLDGGDCMPFP